MSISNISTSYNTINNVTSNVVKKNDSDDEKKVSSTSPSQLITQTLEQSGIKLNNSETSNNQDLNKFMHDLFSTLKENDQNKNSKNQYSNVLNNLQKLVENSNANDSKLNKLKEDFAKITEDSTGTKLQTFLNNLNNNLKNNENQNTLGNSINMFI